MLTIELAYYNIVLINNSNGQNFFQFCYRFASKINNVVLWKGISGILTLPMTINLY
jgi:hypothetical protein